MKRSIITSLLLLLTAPLLSGCLCFACKDQISVQRDYLSARDECQDASELRIESYDAYQQTQANRDPFYALMTPRQKAREQAKMVKERKSMLFNMFKDCMTSKDWMMSRPKEEAQGSPAPNIIDTARKQVNAPRAATPAPAPAAKAVPRTPVKNTSPQSPYLTLEEVLSKPDPQQ